MKEPIAHLLEGNGFDRGMIGEYVIGSRYVAVMLQNGNIGVCATLGCEVREGLMKGEDPNPADPSHRILLNAWFNALLNYSRSYSYSIDIFDRIDFRSYGRIVMAGYFESLYEKFSRSGIEVEVFDLDKESNVLADISGFSASAATADTIILTGTSIQNNSFLEITGMSRDGCRIFLLGPSNILSEDMFLYRNVSVVFGSVFNPWDMEVLKLIGYGKGTRGFLSYLKKVYIAKDL